MNENNILSVTHRTHLARIFFFALHTNFYKSIHFHPVHVLNPATHKRTIHHTFSSHKSVAIVLLCMYSEYSTHSIIHARSEKPAHRTLSSMFTWSVRWCCHIRINSVATFRVTSAINFCAKSSTKIKIFHTLRRFVIEQMLSKRQNVHIIYNLYKLLFHADAVAIFPVFLCHLMTCYRMRNTKKTFTGRNHKPISRNSSAWNMSLEKCRLEIGYQSCALWNLIHVNSIFYTFLNLNVSYIIVAPNVSDFSRLFLSI